MHNNMNAERALKILFIGSDHIGDRALLKTPYEAAYCDAFDEGCDAFPEKPLPLDAALQTFKPDAAVVGVPNTRKNIPAAEVAVMDAGIPLLIQKFRLRDFSDYEMIRGAAAQRNAQVYIGEFYRLTPVAETVRQFIRAERLGKLEYLRWTCAPNHPYAPWESTYRHLALEDLAFHHLSVMSSWMPLRPVSVYARSLSPRKGGPLGGTVYSALITTADGCVIDHCIDWHHAVERTDFYGNFSLEGERGGLFSRGGVLFFSEWSGGEAREPREVALAEAGPQTGLELFVNALRGLGDHPVSLADFDDVMHTAGLALSSAAT